MILAGPASDMDVNWDYAVLPLIGQSENLSVRSTRYYKDLSLVRSDQPTLQIVNGLTLTERSSSSLESCPDCGAEEAIRKREDAEINMTSSISSVASSTFTEPATPVNEDSAASTIISTHADNQVVNLPGASIPESLEADEMSLVTADLGDMIDTIIIEHRGTLQRVITNLRDGVPRRERVQRISEDLSKVSEQLGSLTAHDRRAELDTHRPYSIILDTPPEILRSHTKSMADLMQYVDAAAADLRVKLPATVEHRPTRLARPQQATSDIPSNNIRSSPGLLIPGLSMSPALHPSPNSSWRSQTRKTVFSPPDITNKVEREASRDRAQRERSQRRERVDRYESMLDL